MVFENLASQFQSWAFAFSGQWGYGGIFLVSFLGNASIIFPVPVFLVIFALGSILNPWILGAVMGVGAALGELTRYALGWEGRSWSTSARSGWRRSRIDSQETKYSF